MTTILKYLTFNIKQSMFAVSCVLQMFGAVAELGAVAFDTSSSTLDCSSQSTADVQRSRRGNTSARTVFFVSADDVVLTVFVWCRVEPTERCKIN